MEIIFIFIAVGALLAVLKSVFPRTVRFGVRLLWLAFAVQLVMLGGTFMWVAIGYGHYETSTLVTMGAVVGLVFFIGLAVAGHYGRRA